MRSSPLRGHHDDRTPTRLLGRPGLRALALAGGVIVALTACGATAQDTPGPTSQNGWPAVATGTDERLAPFPWVTGRVLAGDVYTVLSYVAERFDAEVEPIDVESSWGWAGRSVRGSSEDLSNHASGTAIDLNATRHPHGASDTFTDSRVAAIRAILTEVEPVVRWGGDYVDRKDEMHFEVVGSADEVAEVAARLTAGTDAELEPSLGAAPPPTGGRSRVTALARDGAAHRVD